MKSPLRYLPALISTIGLVTAMSANADLLVDRGLPNAQQSSDLSWSDEEFTGTPNGYVDAGGSFSMSGSGTYRITGITVWDVVNNDIGIPTGLSLLNASGSRISSGYAATVATYGNGKNYVPANPDGYPPATLYKLNFAVDVLVNAGSTYDFFLDGPLTDYSSYGTYPAGNYFNSFLLCNDASSDPVLWLENLNLPGTSPDVISWDGYNGDAYVQVEGTPVPEPSTYLAGALLLLPFGASTVRKLRENRAA
jgi:hypothetical protein